MVNVVTNGGRHNRDREHCDDSHPELPEPDNGQILRTADAPGCEEDRRRASTVPRHLTAARRRARPRTGHGAFILFSTIRKPLDAELLGEMPEVLGRKINRNARPALAAAGAALV